MRRRPGAVLLLAFALAFAPLAAAPLRGEVTVAAALLPPHMDEQGEGRGAHIIRAIVQDCAGERVRFAVFPFPRQWRAYQDRHLDAADTVASAVALPGFASADYIALQNGATVLATAAPVERVADLAGRRAVIFPHGAAILGLAGVHFAQLVERADQLEHSRLLFAKKVDVVVADGLIVAEYNRRLREATRPLPFDPAQPVRFRAIFPPSAYHMVFRDKSLQQRFDRCLHTIEQEGRIAAINRRYVERYRDTVDGQYLRIE
jgi:hypothetical protein